VDAPVKNLPQLTQASAPLTQAVDVIDAEGQPRAVSIPAERDLTLYVDKREIITLMTLGAHPEWLTLGYLLNQRMIRHAYELESITVDWSVNASAVKTRFTSESAPHNRGKRIVTTGCGQGTLFGSLMDELDSLHLAPAAAITRDTVFAIVQAIRERDTVYKNAGSVHACALFEGSDLRCFIEDVGRHNALDSIAGWLALGDLQQQTAPWVLYTTGRLTSEMIIKAAQMGVSIVISRSGMTQMGLEIARRLGVCAIGRALNRHFLCFSAEHRLIAG